MLAPEQVSGTPDRGAETSEKAAAGAGNVQSWWLVTGGLPLGRSPHKPGTSSGELIDKLDRSMPGERMTLS